MHLNCYTVSVTTDSSGDATRYTAPATGFVRAIRYVPHGTTPLDTNADVTVTGNTSGIGVYTKANIGTSAFTVQPRAACASAVDGAALTYDGTRVVNDLIPVADEAIKVVVAQGADTKSGTFYIYVG